MVAAAVTTTDHDGNYSTTASSTIRLFKAGRVVKMEIPFWTISLASGLSEMMRAKSALSYTA